MPNTIWNLTRDNKDNHTINVIVKNIGDKEDKNREWLTKKRGKKKKKTISISLVNSYLFSSQKQQWSPFFCFILCHNMELGI